MFDGWYWSKEQKRGVVILLLVAMVCLGIWIGKEVRMGNRMEQAVENAHEGKQEKEKSGRAHDYEEKEEGNDWKKRYERKRRAMTVDLHPFDPNTADSVELVKVGMSPRMASNVLKYRAKGGHYWRKEDLVKVYGMTEELYLKLEPYIRIEKKTSSDKTVEKQGLELKKQESGSRDTSKLYLNDMDTSMMVTVHGVSIKVARRIAAYGKRLGGYRDTAQLREALYFMQPGYIAYLQRKTMVDTSKIVRVDVNHVSVERLRSHPYIDFFQAKAIYSYRRNHGKIKGVQDLHKIEELDSLFFKRALPYLKW